MKKQKMSNHIEEYFTNIEGNKELMNSKALFEADSDNIDLKTHLTDREIAFITTLLFNNDILKEHNLKPIFKDYLINFMRLKVSKDRLSRTEFVNISRNNNPDEMLNTMSNLKNITDVKK